MATAAQDQSSIPLPEIPVRLRCTICQGLLRGAVRLPCCEQAICENCRANLPTVCPVCDHSPLSSDDCHPNSTLRTTVAVFLKTAEKKHALALQKEERERLQKLQQQQPAASPAPTSVQPVQEVKAPAPQPAAAQSPVASVAQAASPPASNATGAPVIEAQITNEENREVANADQETEEQEQQQHQNVDGQISAEGQAPTQQMNPAQQQMGYQQNGWYNGQQMNMAQQQQMFPGQDFSQWGAYNPMIAMGGWNNGYGANNMMGFNMMDPMVMSQVGYGGGEFGGMGGNGGMGMGWNGWNGQGNMGYGQSMGMRNGGYYAGSGGYNHQSQANHQVPHQQYQNPHVHRQQNFSRGGGFVAGGPQRNAGPYGNPNAPNQQNINANQTAVASDTPAHNFSTQLQGIDDAVAAVKQPTSEAPGEGISSASADDESTAIVLIDSSSADRKEVPPTAATTDTPASADGTSQIPTVGHSDVANMQATFPDDYNQGMMMMNNNMNTHYGGFARGRGGFRGNPGFRGGMRGGHISPPIGPNPGLGKGVEGAPAAPKAMREGRPNRGMINRGAFGGMGRGNFGGPISVINTGGSRPSSISPTVPSNNNINSNPDARDARSYSRSVSPRRTRRSPSVRRRTPSPTPSRGRTPSCDRYRDRVRDASTPTLAAVSADPTPADDSPMGPPRQRKRSRSNSRSPSRSRSSSHDRRHKRSRRHRDRDRSSRRHRHRRHRSRDDKDRGAEKEKDQQQPQEPPIADEQPTNNRSRRHRRRSSRDRRERRRRAREGNTNATENDATPSTRDDRDKAEGSREKEKERGGGERKLSYKYEDEGDLERRAERDREAERWGV